MRVVIASAYVVKARSKFELWISHATVKISVFQMILDARLSRNASVGLDDPRIRSNLPSAYSSFLIQRQIGTNCRGSVFHGVLQWGQSGTVNDTTMH
jgi:hypothetical protein